MTTKELLENWQEIANKNKREYSEEELYLIKIKHEILKALAKVEFVKDNIDKLEVTVNYKE